MVMLWQLSFCQSLSGRENGHAFHKQMQNPLMGQMKRMRTTQKGVT